jgi:hypothetical protein
MEIIVALQTLEKKLKLKVGSKTTKVERLEFATKCTIGRKLFHLMGIDPGPSKTKLLSGLPDGLFLNPKSQF